MNAFPQYIAFDLGASSSRAVLGTLAEGRMQMEELHRFKTPLIEEEERLYWDLGALWDELQRGLQMAFETASHLRSLSVDSWAVDYVPLDADDEPLRRPYCYRDARTDGCMEKAFARVPKETIYQTTGIQFLPFNTLYQVLTDKEQHPSQYQRTRRRLLIADYFNHRFGGRAVADESMASTTQLMDVRSFGWATGLMDAFELDPGAWPEIVPCGTRLGPLRLEEAEAAGSAASEVEIIAGLSHDTACAVAAVPARAGGSAWAYLSCGTWSLLGVERAEPILTEAAREAGFTNEVGLGGTIRFLKNLTGLWVLEECMRVWEENGAAASYEELTAEAAAAPPSAALIDLNAPRFAERGEMPQKLKACCKEQGQPVPSTRGALVRLILESLAADYRQKLGRLEAVTDEPVDVLHLVGGGARNALLCQLTADACQRRVVAGPAEATALGNLLVQARAMGDLPEGLTVREAARQSSTLTTYHPEPQVA